MPSSHGQKIQKGAKIAMGHPSGRRKGHGARSLGGR